MVLDDKWYTTVYVRVPGGVPLLFISVVSITINTVRVVI